MDYIVLRAIAADPLKRYGHYSELLYELKVPEKVKPYFPDNATLMERNPVLFYRTAFTVMFLLKLLTLAFFLK
ncbi:MAG: hypothetical protein B5M52_00965 [Helicobacteraceae bacterium 4484_230]|nr:MAG: hypothetical protein B5M52_00965 [Helicobacteraceae bacterium 4484_230]